MKIAEFRQPAGDEVCEKNTDGQLSGKQKGLRL